MKKSIYLLIVKNNSMLSEFDEQAKAVVKLYTERLSFFITISTNYTSLLSVDR